MILASASASASVQVSWTQTARLGEKVTLLEDQTPFVLSSGECDGCPDPAISVDSKQTFQTFEGFGGAFTQASAVNWRKLDATGQAELIRAYFADPADGGLGYTLCRVPINSCDFSPESYTFDDVEGDVALEHFDSTVQKDVDLGMIDMILAAEAAVKERANRTASKGLKLKLLASPWSPPAWMKLPVHGVYGDPGEGIRTMTGSAKPFGLDPDYQASWANYFGKWLAAYKARGVDSLWAVTVQNEPEASPGWESCLWTPEYMANFVAEHLGPTLNATHPEIKIFGFDHNKDHVAEWADGLYKNKTAADYFTGVAVHWYGGLNTENLQKAHEVDPTKSILGSEACNCIGHVVLQQDGVASWWTRAERVSLDILEDLKWWAVGWIDWNLLVDVNGGPNHLKNLCDANMIQDVAGQKGDQPLIKQASYYYMGHFSRYLVPGAKRVQVSNTVEVEIPQVTAGDIKDGSSPPACSLLRSSLKTELERRSPRAIWGHLGPISSERRA